MLDQTKEQEVRRGKEEVTSGAFSYISSFAYSTNFDRLI